MGRDPAATLAWAKDGAEHLRGLMSRMGDDAFSAPSGLPDWSRAHLLSHVARNADALINLLAWARSGIRTAAYGSEEQRDADIDAGAARPVAEIRADVVDSSDRLATAVHEMPAKAWSATVEMRGRDLLAIDVTWLRAVETWVHAVDLDVGSEFTDLPQPMLSELMAEVTGAMSARPGCPGLVLVATDAPAGRWDLGPGEHRQEVGGSAPALLAWLLGRSTGRRLHREGALPHLPPWR